jgi:hypothetical protein
MNDARLGSTWVRLGLSLWVFFATVSSATAQAPCASNHLRTWFPRGTTPGADSRINAIATTPGGDRVAMAASFYQHQGMQIGKVWVLSGWGTSASPEAGLIPPIYNNQMRFGSALAINESGDLLVAGARASSGWPGRVFVYRRNGESWAQEWETSGSYNDWLGASVAVDAIGDVLAVGAPLRTNPGPGFIENGAVEIYRRQANSWVMETTITPAHLPMAKSLGNRVVLSRDGTVLAVSSHAFSNEPVPSGAVYILQYSGGAWTMVARLQEPVAYSLGGFGVAFGMDAEATVLAVGNFQDSRVAYYQGAVTIFRKGSTGWAYDSTRPEIDCASGQRGPCWQVST